MEHFSITSTVQSYSKKVPYEQIKDEILGSTYVLSLVFIGTHRAQKLNKKYRKENYTPNILSFPLTETRGEIFITPKITIQEATKRGMTIDGYTGFLFIHGLLHLKGYAHSDTMEVLEKKYILKFKLK